MNVDPIGPIILCNIASMSSLITPMATGVVPLAMTTGGYNLKTIMKAGIIPAYSTWCCQCVSDYDHVPDLGLLPIYPFLPTLIQVKSDGSVDLNSAIR